MSLLDKIEAVTTKYHRLSITASMISPFRNNEVRMTRNIFLDLVKMRNNRYAQTSTILDQIQAQANIFKGNDMRQNLIRIDLLAPNHLNG